MWISKVTTDLCQEFYSKFEGKYSGYVQVYKDGLKDPESEATGSSRIKYQVWEKNINFLSIYAVELYAILMALEWVEDSRIAKVIICSDSLSAVLRIENGNTSNDQNILYEVMFAHHRVCEQGKSVVITLMPVIKAIWLMKERIRWLKLLKE